MNATITVLHPGVESRAQGKPVLAPRLASLEGKRVALLDNGKVNGGALLATVAARLKSLGIGDVRAWKKQHAAQSADKLFPELLAWKPDLLLTAIGD